MKNKQAFTLIELLVVVLIIGILAAVALPQYQKVVEKSKATQAITLLKSLVAAADTYYLANGEYAFDLEALPTQSSCKIITVNDGTTLTCDNYFGIDIIGHTQDMTKAQHYFIDAYYCPEYSATNIPISTCLGHSDFTYKVWLDHSTNPGQITCTGTTALGQKICANP